MRIPSIVAMGTSVAPDVTVNPKASTKRNHWEVTLTFGDAGRRRQEVSVHGFGDGAQSVAGFQGVVAVVDVGGVLEGQAALQVVLVEVHLCPDVLVLQDLLLLVEPAQLGVGVTPYGELDAGVVTLLRLRQPHDDRRN